MPVSIHDKNPRKPKVEGPKAQERYIEELNAEWIDDHATTHKPLPFAFPDQEHKVPENVKARYEAAELQTRMAEVDRKYAWLEKTKDRARVEVVARKAAWEVRELGMIRDATATEMAELGLSQDLLI